LIALSLVTLITVFLLFIKALNLRRQTAVKNLSRAPVIYAMLTALLRLNLIGRSPFFFSLETVVIFLALSKRSASSSAAASPLSLALASASPLFLALSSFTTPPSLLYLRKFGISLSISSSSLPTLLCPLLIYSLLLY